MSIVTTVKQTSKELEALIEEFIMRNGIVRVDSARARGSRSEGSRHRGKPTYMRGNRRAA